MYEDLPVNIPEDYMERKKWMWSIRQEHTEHFSLFHADEQPLPPMEIWHPDIYEIYRAEPDEKGNFDPRVMRHLKWWEKTKEFLRHRFELKLTPDYFFNCLVAKCRGRFSEAVDEKDERRWYLRALRMGAFIFNGKVGVGFSCRSKKCRRISCPLNVHRRRKARKRLNRVDLFQLMRIFYGKEKMLLTEAVREVSAAFGIPLHDFGSPYYTIPKEAFVRLVNNYREDAPKLIKNFLNRCTGKRSHLVYFFRKPPAELYRDYFFFPQSLVVEKSLEKISHPAVILYLHLFITKLEAATANAPFIIQTPAEIEVDTEARSYKVSRRSAQRYLEHLKSIGLLENKNSGENL